MVGCEVSDALDCRTRCERMVIQWKRKGERASRGGGGEGEGFFLCENIHLGVSASNLMGSWRKIGEQDKNPEQGGQS